MMKRIINLILIFLFLLVIAGCEKKKEEGKNEAPEIKDTQTSQTAQAMKTNKDVIVFNNGTEPQTIDPALSVDLTEARIILCCFEGLVRVNAENKIQGRTTISHLSEKGLKQAMELAERLKHEHIDAIYTSARHRAVETATEINRWHNLPLRQRTELDEQDMGILVGRKRDELSPEYDKIYTRSKADPAYRIPDGESFNDLVDRVRPVVDEVVRRQGTILIVGCGRALKAMIHVLTGKTFAELVSLWFPNSGMVEFEIADGKVKVLKDEMVPR